MKATSARLVDGSLLGCVIVEAEDAPTIDELLEQCAKWEACLLIGREEYFMVKFPGLDCQLYTRQALKGSLSQL